MAEVLLFHHAQGLTSGVRDFADTLRAAGHTVHVPDLYDGHVFEDIESGLAYADERRVPDRAGAGAGHGRPAAGRARVRRLLARRAARADARPDAPRREGRPVLPLVRPDRRSSTARGPTGVPVQIHGMDADPFFAGEGDIDAARALVKESPDAELFVYPGEEHLFADNSLPSYDPAAAQLLTERTLAFLAAIR